MPFNDDALIYRQTDRHLYTVGASAGIYMSLNMLCFSHLPGKSDYIPNVVLLHSLIIVLKYALESTEFSCIHTEQ
jgi:hypothetical protein